MRIEEKIRFSYNMLIHIYFDSCGRSWEYKFYLRLFFGVAAIVAVALPILLLSKAYSRR
jgi:hypothetical protein